MGQKNVDIESLNPEDRLLLIERLWDSLDDSEASFTLTTAQQQELDSRLDRIDAGDDAGIPWEKFMSELKSRLG